MANSRFVYVTYIRTTPEKLWRALIEPEFTRQFWVGTWQESEWKPGASWRIMISDGRVGDSGDVEILYYPQKERGLLGELAELFGVPLPERWIQVALLLLVHCFGPTHPSNFSFLSSNSLVATISFA